MRRRLIALVLSATFLTQLAGVAVAAPSWCEIQRKLGYVNVRECEDPTS